MNCAIVLLMIGNCTCALVSWSTCGMLALNDFGAQYYEGLMCLVQGLTGGNSPETQIGYKPLGGHGCRSTETLRVL